VGEAEDGGVLKMSSMAQLILWVDKWGLEVTARGEEALNPPDGAIVVRSERKRRRLSPTSNMSLERATGTCSNTSCSLPCLADKDICTHGDVHLSDRTQHGYRIDQDAVEDVEHRLVSYITCRRLCSAQAPKVRLYISHYTR
jgi:hypothetical protein